jgi:peroxiredoxin
MRRGGLVLFVLVALLVSAPAIVAALEVGDKAPAFSLPATTQEKLSLSDFAGKKNVVLFSFIGAFTPT